MSALVVRVLGPVEVMVDGAPVDLGGALPRRLLAALREVAEEELAAARLAGGDGWSTGGGWRST